jgi:hypothetical protein
MRALDRDHRERFGAEAQRTGEQTEHAAVIIGEGAAPSLEGEFGAALAAMETAGA